MAKPELGLKRQCMSCGAKFYDLNKDPAVCPKCGTVFQASPSGRAAAAGGRAARQPRRRSPRLETAGPEMVSLEEVEAGEADKESRSTTISTWATTSADDDTFLEEEEEGDDDVSDLIDGDIEDDEEA